MNLNEQVAASEFGPRPVKMDLHENSIQNFKKSRKDLFKPFHRRVLLSQEKTAVKGLEEIFPTFFEILDRIFMEVHFHWSRSKFTGRHFGISRMGIIQDFLFACPLACVETGLAQVLAQKS